MNRTMLLYEKVDYCPIVHGGCGEPLEWTPGGSRPGEDAVAAGDVPDYLEATCGSCGHYWRLPPGVGIHR